MQHCQHCQPKQHWFQADVQTDKHEFIGPFQLKQGVQQNENISQIKNITWHTTRQSLQKCQLMRMVPLVKWCNSQWGLRYGQNIN